MSIEMNIVKEEIEQWREIVKELLKETPPAMKIVMGLGMILSPVLILAYYLYEWIHKCLKGLS